MIPYYVLGNILVPRHNAVGKTDRNTFSWGAYISGEEKPKVNKISKQTIECNDDKSCGEKKNEKIECWVVYGFSRVKGVFFVM